MSPPRQLASNQALRIGIETEFYLLSKKPSQSDENLQSFASSVVAVHQANVPPQLPRMMENVNFVKNGGLPADQYHKFWRLVKDETVDVDVGGIKTKAKDSDIIKTEMGDIVKIKDLPWGLEMVSPILQHRPDDNWTQPIIQTWSALQKEFVVLTDDHCSTHVHMSLPKEQGEWSIVQLRLIAKAIIHFEPAVEAILPECRRGNKSIKSNFLHIISGLGDEVTKDEVFEYLDQWDTAKQLIESMHSGYRKTGWDFLALNRFGTVEFRLGAGSTSADDVFMWVELATKFVRAALAAKSHEEFTSLDPNVGGLRKFLIRGTMEGEGQDRLEATLFSGKKDGESLRPQDIKMTKDNEPIGKPFTKAGVNAHDGKGAHFLRYKHTS